MKTAELIETLAADTDARSPVRVGPRLALALAGGGAMALALLILWLGGQPLVDLLNQSWFWMKTGYTAALIVPGSLMLIRASRPGALLKAAPPAIAAIFILMLVFGLLQLLQVAPEQRMAAWRGATWTICSPRILLLSVPIYLCLLAALRTLAPTDLTRAGAAAGFVSGSLAATIYALHCQEHGAAFVATWYSLGIAAAAALGAAAGRWLLRW